MSPRPKKLSPDMISQFLADLDGWKRVEGREAIAKTFIFKDFKEAFAWMTKVARIADEMDHHPEWSNVYKTVEVTLATHDVDGLSELDIRLAARMNALIED
ncbi:MAG: 4a-hydroxytetrahydrobiopterin dehydratase [Beijerinckiaceae bacterium]|nr:4a-hydroxytetrahydrobiopterin dehydratase [Beijerinckiaceae bacterium]